MGNSLGDCLAYLANGLSRCEYFHFILNGEKCHFMVKERIVYGHNISKRRIEVYRDKIKVIEKFPPLIFQKVFNVFRSCMLLYMIHQELF